MVRASQSMRMPSPSRTSAIGPPAAASGPDVADHHAPRRAGEASIGDERHLLAHALAVDQRGDAEHLAHARPAPRALVADHQHLAVPVLRASRTAAEARLLALEDARAALEHQRLQAGDLDQRAVGREVALAARRRRRSD